MTTMLSPSPKLQFFASSGDFLVGGKLYTYAAGTTTPLTTYTDSSGPTANTNPIILNSRGEAVVFLPADTAYRFILKTDADVSIWTQDDIIGVNTAVSSEDVTVENAAVVTDQPLNDVLDDYETRITGLETTTGSIGDLMPKSGGVFTGGVTGPISATESTAGMTEIATLAEVNAGADDERYITPEKLADTWRTAVKVIRFQGRSSNGTCTMLTNLGGTARAERLASGVYRLLFSTTGTGDDMPDANFVPVVNCIYSATPATVGGWNTSFTAPANSRVCSILAQDTTGLVFSVESTGATYGDPDYISVNIHGSGA